MTDKLLRTPLLAAAFCLWSASAMAQAPPLPVRHLHAGDEVWVCTDAGGGEGGRFAYQLGTGSNVTLLGFYGNVALAKAIATSDAYEREMLFSITSGSPESGQETDGYSPSNHGADGSLYVGTAKQDQISGDTFNLPINVTIPGGGVVIPNGAIAINFVTGAYDPNNGFNPVTNWNGLGCMDAEIHLTFYFQ